MSVLTGPAITGLTFLIGTALELGTIADGSVYDLGATQVMGLLLDGQFVAGGIEITLICSALAHIIAGIGGGHLRDDQSVALLLYPRGMQNEFQLGTSPQWILPEYWQLVVRHRHVPR